MSKRMAHVVTDQEVKLYRRLAEAEQLLREASEPLLREPVLSLSYSALMLRLRVVDYFRRPKSAR